MEVICECPCHVNGRHDHEHKKCSCHALREAVRAEAYNKRVRERKAAEAELRRLEHIGRHVAKRRQKSDGRYYK